MRYAPKGKKKAAQAVCAAWLRIAHTALFLSGEGIQAPLTPRGAFAAFFFP